MAEIKLNIEINGTLDADVIAEEVNYHVRRELERIKASAPKPLKVGDYVKVVAAESSVAKNGDLFKIIRQNCGFPFEGERVTDGAVEQFFDREIVRATDEEVAEAKQKLEAAIERKAIEEKWAKIGRKPNELKVGDAVQYKNAFTTVTGIKPGGIVALNQLNHTKRNLEVSAEELTLVFPAEARFDA